MATDTIISNAAAIAACNAIVDLLDVGGGGSIKLYTEGSGVPADVDTALSDQTLLATLPLAATAFGNAADNTGKATATAAAITSDSSADNPGTAAFFRACDAAGTAVIQGTVGTSGADLNMNSVAISSGATVSISSWTFSVPEQA
jgi:hypothetical protein